MLTSISSSSRRRYDAEAGWTEDALRGKWLLDAGCGAGRFAEIAADSRNELMVAVRGDSVIGCLQITFIPGLSRRGAERAQIESVRVARSQRGQGLGRVLFDWAIERARTRGCSLVQLTSDKGRPEAHRFYEQLGFVASHEGMKLSL